MLLSEDDTSVRRALAYCLRLAGHVVTEAAGGQEAVRAFGAATVDLVVTDLEMPDLSGWEVARAIRSLRPHVPVVLITGNTEATEAAPHLRALVHAILLKPFGPRALLDVVAGLTTSGGTTVPMERAEQYSAPAPRRRVFGLPVLRKNHRPVTPPSSRGHTRNGVR